jgi:hypothetical protein
MIRQPKSMPNGELPNTGEKECCGWDHWVVWDVARKQHLTRKRGDR